MDVYRLVSYGISKIFMVIGTGLFIRWRYSRRWTLFCLVMMGGLLLGSEYLRYYLYQIGIEQRITNFLEFGLVLMVPYLSKDRDSRAFFSGVLICVYGSMINIVSKLFYSAGAPMAAGCMGTVVAAAATLFLMVRYFRPAYWKLQEVYSREWRLFSLVLSMFMLALYLIFGAFKGLKVTFCHNLAVLFYLIVISILMIMAFRMLEQRWAEERKQRAQEILEVFESALRQEMDQVHQMERRVSEFNHDTRHFVRMLGGMLAEKNYDGIRQTLEQIRQSELKNSLTDAVLSSVIRGILIYYEKRSAEAEIRMTVEADLVNPLGEHEWELAAILGNLLENAVYACLEMVDANRRKIRVNIHPAGGQTIFELRHSVGRPVELDPVTGYPVVAWGRGMQMRSMAADVEKWGGQMDWGQERDSFFVRILV